MAKWNVPASVTIAQWALESDWGRAVPPGSNNCKGIMARCHPRSMGSLPGCPLDGLPIEPYVLIWTHEVINGKRIRVMRPLRKFASMAECFDVHGELLGTKGAYAKGRVLLPKDRAPTEGEVEAYVRAIGPVYATAPNYAKVIISIMRGRNLYQYNS